MHFIQRIFPIGVLVALIAATISSARAAELRLRSDAKPSGNVIKLGDIAEILGADDAQAQSLGDLELGPAPPPGKQRQISVREIQDTLERRGMNLLQCHFSGASQVNVSAAADAAKPAAPKSKSVPLSSIQEANKAVTDAAVRYLHQVAGSNNPWTVDVDLHHLEVRGGQQPWIGTQSFDVEVRGDQGPAVFTISAKVTLPAAVVVTVKDVPCGAIIQADDVELQRVKSGPQPDGAFSSLDDVVGREAILAIAQGQILDPDYVRASLLVRRGDIVTVYAVAPGVKVRTTARAREDGSRGQCITVESLLDRRTFIARVTGNDQLEIDADATTMLAVGGVADNATPPAPRPSSQARKPVPAPSRLAAGHNVRTVANDTTNNLDNR
jgi:flagella basal body P-ring formation protein FlgA